MERAVTLIDIAERSGFSKSTVSLALQHDPRIKANTRDAILAVAAEMGYDAAHHDIARRMVLSKRGQDIIHSNVGLILISDHYTLPYYFRTHHGILTALTEAGYSMVIMQVAVADADKELPLPRCFARGDIDGVIWGPGTEKFRLLHLAIEHHPYLGKRPSAVALGPYFNYAAVTVDVRQGAYEATRHLLALGHRHLLHITLPFLKHFVSFQQRLAGVRKAFREYQLDPACYLHCFIPTGAWHNEEADRREVTAFANIEDNDLIQFLRVHPEITGILARNDFSAQQIWYVLQEAGISVPEEMSLIGFDDTDPLLDARGRNILTTVRLPLEQVGQESVHLLIEQIEQQHTTQVRRVLPTELVVRHSTGPARPTF